MNRKFRDRTKLRVTPRPAWSNMDLHKRGECEGHLVGPPWGGWFFVPPRPFALPRLLFPSQAPKLRFLLLLDPAPSGILRGTFDGRPIWDGTGGKA
jgi:hypothetical protein